MLKIYRFQFPSNGKAQRKTLLETEAELDYFVSIPFKRESTAKVTQALGATGKFLGNMFQFPSNGKAQRKPTQRTRQSRRHPGFNSLQTGKHSESLKLCD